MKTWAVTPLLLAGRPSPAAELRAPGAEHAAEWQPAFLNEHQNETLILLSDWIIPDTNTPGAKAVLANRFIDLVLAAEAHGVQAAFLQSLNAVDQESTKRYGKVFRFLSSAQQQALLDTAEAHADAGGIKSLHAHFENIKLWVSRAFYTTEIGMRELGWNGMPPHGSLTEH